MTSTLRSGVVAGAVGTVALDTFTYLDMLLTGRAASDAPGRSVLGLARRLGASPPSDASRLAAYGQVGGLLAGVGVGVAASLARRLGLRPPASVATVLTGAAAMALTDASLMVTDTADPRDWSTLDWARDVGPHLVYGAGVQWTLGQLADDNPSGRPSASGGLVLRSAVLGVASGSRASFSVLGPALVSGRSGPATIAMTLAATELVMDKLPATPSRLEPQGQLSRLGAGAVGGVALAAHDGSLPLWPVLAGTMGAAAGAIAGAAWREAAADRGWTWQGGLVEDAVALGLVGLVVRSARRASGEG